MQIQTLKRILFLLLGLPCLVGCLNGNTADPKSTRGIPTATPTITLPTPEFTPQYLLDIQPAPSSRVSLEHYQKDERGNTEHEGARDVESWGHRSNVCVYFDVAPIIQPGETLLEYHQLAAKTRLFVDEVELDPKPDPGFVRPDILKWVEVEIEGEEKQEQEKATYGAPYWLCWPAELSVGVHLARFTFEQQTGFIYDYEWQFELRSE